MTGKSKTAQIEALLVDTLPTPYELVLHEYVKASGAWVLRVYIDHPEGVTLDRCEEVSRLLSEALDAQEILDQAYNLEVSSPGVDRPLTKFADFERFVGERIFVKTRTAVDGRKTFVGKLLLASDQRIEVELEDENTTQSLDYADVTKATLKPLLDFN